MYMLNTIMTITLIPPSSPVATISFLLFSSLSSFSETKPFFPAEKESFVIYKPPMSAQDKGPPLPKFGEWDVNNPASAEGFTVIFSKAREEKKGTAGGDGPKSQNPKPVLPFSPTKKRFCCF